MARKKKRTRAKAGGRAAGQRLDIIAPLERLYVELRAAVSPERVEARRREEEEALRRERGATLAEIIGKKKWRGRIRFDSDAARVVVEAIRAGKKLAEAAKLAGLSIDRTKKISAGINRMFQAVYRRKARPSRAKSAQIKKHPENT